MTTGIDAKLVEVIERHLPYEIGMLFSTYKRLEAGEPDHDVRNALIEAFCIHARNLIDFLKGKRKGVRARSVTDGYTPFAGTKIDRALTKKIEDQIAHLSIGRTSDPNEKIDGRVRSVLLWAIATELVEFQRHLKPQYRTAWKIEATGERIAVQMGVLPETDA